VSKGRVLKELMQFLRAEKKYWLVPTIVFFALLGFLMMFSQASAISPFIYTLF
jgi:Family of unknown function (DUF5989)